MIQYSVHYYCLPIFLFRFWLAVEGLKKRPIRDVPVRVQEIWQEFLAPGAPSAINLDSKSYDKTTQNVKEPGRYTFGDAQVGRIICTDMYSVLVEKYGCEKLFLALPFLFNNLLLIKNRFGPINPRYNFFESTRKKSLIIKFLNKHIIYCGL